VRLEDLSPGQPFHVTALPEWRAVVVSQGQMGTRVKKLGKKVRTMSVTDRDTNKKVTKTIEADHDVECISSGTEVTCIKL
jgi:hypothetical protein